MSRDIRIEFDGRALRYAFLPSTVSAEVQTYLEGSSRYRLIYSNIAARPATTTVTPMANGALTELAAPVKARGLEVALTVMLEVALGGQEVV